VLYRAKILSLNRRKSFYILNTGRLQKGGINAFLRWLVTSLLSIRKKTSQTINLSQVKRFAAKGGRGGGKTVTHCLRKRPKRHLSLLSIQKENFHHLADNRREEKGRCGKGGEGGGSISYFGCTEEGEFQHRHLAKRSTLPAYSLIQRNYWEKKGEKESPGEGA